MAEVRATIILAFPNPRRPKEAPAIRWYFGLLDLLATALHLQQPSFEGLSSPDSGTAALLGRRSTATLAGPRWPESDACFGRSLRCKAEPPTERERCRDLRTISGVSGRVSAAVMTSPGCRSLGRHLHSTDREIFPSSP